MTRLQDQWRQWALRKIETIHQVVGSGVASRQGRKAEDLFNELQDG